ncbi:hypothetical protein BDV93DRAFT_522544 [Ceratobasidium sp. AG-I]|nr:hypothetical protein BDV93DRAFT_522544 [Ceratobasidium sp. AG-I]
MSLNLALTETQVQEERAWLSNFNRALDSLDVLGRWAPFWAEDAFVQFSNLPRVENKPAVLADLARLFGYFQFVKHQTLRVSLDPANGLIYHTASVSMQVKGDPQERIFTVPSLTVLHKRVGEQVTTGMEVYIDISQATDVLKELAAQD